MKKQLLFGFIAAAFIISCTTNGSGSEQNRSIMNISDISGKEWRLIEVHINGVDTKFSRNTLSNDFSRDMYTATFDAADRQIVSGFGFPNRYSAPFTLGDNQSIKIMAMISTMMAPLFQIDGLNEHDFFAYMQNSEKWEIIGNKLELYSKTTDNRNVRLVFE